VGAELESNREDATLEHHCELWERDHGVRVSISTMSRAIRKSSAGHSKKDAGSLRARRKRENCLARDRL